MGPNLLGDQTLPPDFIFCRIPWWKASICGTWTVVVPNIWHEIYPSLSTSLNQEGHVTYGDNNKGKIFGKGIVGNENNFLIHDVLHVEGLKHNLLSISQLCDKGYQVTFTPNNCYIRLSNSQEVLLVGKRVNNIYLLHISNPTSIGCLLTKHEESWLWHRRIAHFC